MRPLLTPDEARELDRVTQEAGTPAAVLMERAGRAVARAALDLAGGAYGRRAIVLAGSGNNGGDGFVAARHLSRAGMRVAVLLLASGHRGPAAEQLARLGSCDVLVGDAGTVDLHRELDRADVAIDAIFGTGFRGVPEGPVAEAISELNASSAPVIAVDVPSGVDGTTGAARLAVVADATVTFGAEKPGLVLFPGAALAGSVEVADIGFAAGDVTVRLGVVEGADVVAAWPARDAASHKRSSGVVLVIAGSRDMTGAPRLVARAAARVGAGLVQVAAPESALPAIQAGLTEATFVGLAETGDGTLAPGAVDALKERIDRTDAVAIGPGIGRHPDTDVAIHELVGSNALPMVVDADALNAFEQRAGSLIADAGALVLTPHAGEAERLLGVSASAIEADRVRWARALADRTGATALLKGGRTVVAEPDGRARINETGTPVLATGGTGDVLTGAIAGLLARGLHPADAAASAAFVHGVAGRIAGDELGEGATAEDVVEALPTAVEEVLSGS